MTSEFDCGLWCLFCRVASFCRFVFSYFVQLLSLLLLHTSEIRLVARPRSKLCGGVKLHFKASSLHILIATFWSLPEAYTVERTMYSIYGSGHGLYLWAQGYNNSCAARHIKKRLCPNIPFDLKCWFWLLAFFKILSFISHTFLSPRQWHISPLWHAICRMGEK